MKKLFLIIILISTVGFLYSQEEKNDNIETLFSKPSKVRGYIGPLNEVTSLDNETAYLSGLNAALIFNDQFVFGFYKLDLESNIFSNNDNYIGSTMNFDHKGLWLGYIFMPKSMVHFNVNVQAGKGNLEVYDPTLDRWLEDDVIFALTPSIEAEFNIARFLRMGIGANYRFALDVDQISGYSDKDFSDLGAFVSFKFGWFK